MVGAKVDPADLCRDLMWADGEDDVIALLTLAGYWDRREVWRHLGDVENNFSAIGNQQSDPIAALVEKIVNGVDARLINACLEAGTDPTRPEAPASIRDAVGRFFESSNVSERRGRVAEWPDQKASDEGRLLTLAATGQKPQNDLPQGSARPSLSIADAGEGQTPDAFPGTFLSLSGSNKLRIHFVQGKFNMGGTGALMFCSERHRLQLIISRRNPELLPPDASGRDSEWGFTVVRRQPGEEGARSSVYTYLAPVGADREMPGRVLSFARPTWPIFPEDPVERSTTGAAPYAREAGHGSLIKLYEYAWKGTKSNIVLAGDGLLRRIDLALPELALPVRLFECRAYSGGPASFSTNALGLVTRLERDKAENLEPGFPIGATFSLEGKRLDVRVYAFKPNKARDYRQSRYGTLFTINGQTHAAYPTDFFRRKSVDLSYIADSLLVVVDCTNIDKTMREDLFMNSRDRLRDTSLAQSLEDSLEKYLKHEAALRALQNARRAERTAERLQDDKPLAQVLESLLSTNPLLSRLLLEGRRVPLPFPPSAGAGQGGAAAFQGKRYPTFFRFKGLRSDQTLVRTIHLEGRNRLAFETDATDDYFTRDYSRGRLTVTMRVGEECLEPPEWILTGPRTGVAQLWLERLPSGLVAGAECDVVVSVIDDDRVEAISNRAVLTAVQGISGGTGGGPRDSAANREEGRIGGQAQLSLPRITPVREHAWDQHGMDSSSALMVHLTESEDAIATYDFFVNVDNRYLREAQKRADSDSGLLEKQFLYGMVVMGLCMLQRGPAEAASDVHSASATDEDPGAFISRTTRALAPVYLPMLKEIGGLSSDSTE